MRRCRVGVWIEQGSRNGRTTPTREEIVLFRPASHAGRERFWGPCGERGQKLGSRWVINQARRFCLSFFARSGIRGAASPPAPIYLPTYLSIYLSVYTYIDIYVYIQVWYLLRNGDMEMSPTCTDMYFKAIPPQTTGG